MPFTDGFAVYNTTDAPALYLDVLCRYIRRWGRSHPRGQLPAPAHAAGSVRWPTPRSDARTGWSRAPRRPTWAWWRPPAPTRARPAGRGCCATAGTPTTTRWVPAVPPSTAAASDRLSRGAGAGVRRAARRGEDASRPSALPAPGERWPTDCRQRCCGTSGCPRPASSPQPSTATPTGRRPAGASAHLRGIRPARPPACSTRLPDAPDLVRGIVGDLYSAGFMTSVGPTMVNRTTTYEGDYLAYQGARTSWGGGDGHGGGRAARAGASGQLAIDLGVHRLLGAVARSGPREHWFLDPPTVVRCTSPAGSSAPAATGCVCSRRRPRGSHARRGRRVRPYASCGSAMPARTSSPHGAPGVPS